jgi:hypothetical protein
MSEHFEELVKALGAGTSRRVALRRFLGGAVAALVASLPGAHATTAAAAGPAEALGGLSSVPLKLNGGPAVNGFKLPKLNGFTPPKLNGFTAPKLNGFRPPKGDGHAPPFLNGFLPPDWKKKRRRR